MDDLRVGDWGTKLVLTVEENSQAKDISGATTKVFRFLKPGSTSYVEKTAEFELDGSDGQLSYTFVDGDIDVAGVWRVQAYVVTPTGAWTSTTFSFDVLKTL